MQFSRRIAALAHASMWMCDSIAAAGLQVFAQVENMGSLYQQFFKWGNLLLDKATKCKAAGDPSADTVVKEITTVLQACPAGAQRHGVPLCAPPPQPDPFSILLPLRMLLSSDPMCTIM